MLRRVSAVKAQRAAETSYGVPEADLSLAERTFNCEACG
jgi:hypothetical protein